MSAHLHFRCHSCGTVGRVPAGRRDDGPTCGKCGTTLSTDGGVLSLSDDDADALIAASPVPVLIDFYADWCGPCRALGPHLAQLAKESSGSLFVVKIDTERFKRKATQLGVSGIPAVHLYAKGSHVDNAVGMRPLPFWRGFVKPYLPAA